MCRNCLPSNGGKPINLARDSSPTNPSGLDGSPLAEDQIDLQAFGTEAFDYFPAEFLESVTTEQGLKENYREHLVTLHTNKLYDTSKITPGMRVITRDRGEGIVTDYHLTEIRQLNSSVEVDFGEGRFDYYYPHQLRKVVKGS
jgi:hypothetical protein